MNSPTPPTIVVIPTYNERENIGALVEALMHTPYSVLIVDDDSPDGTGEVADELSRQHTGRVSVVHRTGPRSFAQSYVDGMRHALALGADRVCQMDADGSHDPSYLPRLIERSGDSDIVVGSRYVAGGGVRDWPLRRRLLSGFANHYVRAITGLPTHDATSGFKCWRREALASVLAQPLQSRGYALQFEMLFHAAAGGWRIDEVPIIFVERRKGRSKISWGMIAESVGAPLRLVLRWRARAARREEGVPS